MLEVRTHVEKCPGEQVQERHECRDHREDEAGSSGQWQQSEQGFGDPDDEGETQRMGPECEPEGLGRLLLEDQEDLPQGPDAFQVDRVLGQEHGHDPAGEEQEHPDQEGHRRQHPANEGHVRERMGVVFGHCPTGSENDRG